MIRFTEWRADESAEQMVAIQPRASLGGRRRRRMAGPKNANSAKMLKEVIFLLKGEKEENVRII